MNLKNNSFYAFSKIRTKDQILFTQNLNLKTDSYTHFMSHPAFYRRTSTNLDTTYGTSLEQKHKLLFTEQTGYISGKAKMAPDGKPYGQAVRGTFNFDIQNANAAQNIDNIIKNGQRGTSVKNLQNLNLKQELLEPPIILKPQQMETFAGKFAPDPSRKYTRDNRS
jgi:hypothetical protein